MWRALLFLLLVLPAGAEEPFSFAQNPGRLPKSVVPVRYSIALDFRNAAQGDFSGTEVVHLQVRQPVRELVFNAVGLKIGLGIWENEAAAKGTPFTTVEPLTDDRTQLVTIHFKTEQPAGTYRLQFTWIGKLTEQPEGLFLTHYDTPAGRKTAITTQMEAADARRMFPCWDEPAFRAVFELSAVVPEHDLAFSNMPLASESPVKGGWKQVVFAPTPAMASYLVAFTTGELETLEGESEGVHLRMITTPGKKEQARYALEATKKILPYYNEYFGTPYPLPKLDQFCYPGFAAGGMENWGAIHYNDTALLVDPGTATQSNRERVFGVVAHEIAHQWFGDLVTMGWWDNLWLNEGFASWMGTKCVDHFNPGWHIADRSIEAKDRAMYRDARSTTHPIQQEVKTEAEASEAFDEITYQKGQAFLRMLESYLGEEKFRDGVRGYMAQHAYGNTTTADLWAALAETAKMPVREMARGWTEQPGFPVVILGFGEKTPSVRQERFAIHQTAPSPLRWQIPLRFAQLVPMLQQEGGRLVTLPAFETEAGISALSGLGPEPLAVKKRASPVVLNAGGTGYYRVQYGEAEFSQLTENIAALPEPDRLTLLLDSWALVQADRLQPEPYLSLLTRLAATDESALLWPEIMHQLRAMDYLQQGKDAQFRAWACARVRPEAERLGWAPKPEESELAKALRGQVLGALGEWDDAATLAEAKKRYEAGVESLAPDLRPTVLRLVGQGADAALWEQLHQRAQAEPSFEVKNQYYRAMGSSRRPELAAKTLELALTDELPPSNSTRFVEYVADSAQMPELAWAFARQHVNELLAKLASIRALSYLPGLARNFSDAPWADELESFAKEHLPATAEKSVAIATDDIRFKAEFKARFLPALQRWIAAGETGAR